MASLFAISRLQLALGSHCILCDSKLAIALQELPRLLRIVLEVSAKRAKDLAARAVESCSDDLRASDNVCFAGVICIALHFGGVLLTLNQFEGLVSKAAKAFLVPVSNAIVVHDGGVLYNFELFLLIRSLDLHSVSCSTQPANPTDKFGTTSTIRPSCSA
jgi:hypothetical protein